MAHVVIARVRIFMSVLWLVVTTMVNPWPKVS